MHYAEALPSPPLRDHIKLFWSLEYDPVGEAEWEKVLPDGCLEIVFNLSDRFRKIGDGTSEIQPATIFAGQMTRSITIAPTGRVRLFGVRFHPTGAYPLVGPVIAELNNSTNGIRECLGQAGAAAEERVNLATGFRERVAVFESFYLNSLSKLRSLNALASRVVRSIVERHGAVKVAALAREMGRSERAIERVFAEQVGISPKMFARLTRFQALIGRVRDAKTPGNLDAMLELEYFDQSHAIRDFREFSGMTPTAYLKSTHGLSDAFTGGSR